MILKKVSGRQQKHGNFWILKVDPLKTARVFFKKNDEMYFSIFSCGTKGSLSTDRAP